MYVFHHFYPSNELLIYVLFSLFAQLLSVNLYFTYSSTAILGFEINIRFRVTSGFTANIRPWVSLQLWSRNPRKWCPEDKYPGSKQPTSYHRTGHSGTQCNMFVPRVNYLPVTTELSSGNTNAPLFECRTWVLARCVNRCVNSVKQELSSSMHNT